MYGKTFEGENFHGFHSFSADYENFPLKYLLCTVHDGHGLMRRESFPVNNVFCKQPRKFCLVEAVPKNCDTFATSGYTVIDVSHLQMAEFLGVKLFPTSHTPPDTLLSI